MSLSLLEPGNSGIILASSCAFLLSSYSKNTCEANPCNRGDVASCLQCEPFELIKKVRKRAKRAEREPFALFRASIRLGYYTSQDDLTLNFWCSLCLVSFVCAHFVLSFSDFILFLFEPRGTNKAQGSQEQG